MNPATTCFAIAGCLALTLAACSKQAPAPASMPFAEPGASLSVTQLSSECDDKGNYRANVAWQVPQTQPARLEIQVGAGERKVFTRSDQRNGNEETGLWVSKDSAFYLVDRESGKVIAATPAPAANCAAMPAE